MHSALKRKYWIAAALGCLALPAGLQSASNLTPNGSEYRIFRTFPGDQANPDVSFNETGGYLVTEDNTVDGSGLGIRARRYFSDLSGMPGTILVNSQTQGHQEQPRVAVLPDGGAVFTWRGSTTEGHRVFARFMGPNGVFLGPEVRVSLENFRSQRDAVPVVLSDGSIVIVWTGEDPGASMKDVYAQRFTRSGTRSGGEFRLNQFPGNNQRNPSAAALPNGQFVVAWVTEDQRDSTNPDDIDIYARIFNNVGQPVRDEFRINDSEKICANPNVVAVGDQGFRAAWTERLLRPGIEGWDVVTRTFDTSGNALSSAEQMNSTLTGDQFIPRLASLGPKQMAVWTSYGQDGSDLGIYGRLMLFPNGFDGDEFRVNGTVVSQQRHPTITSFRDNEFVTAWTSFTGGLASFDIFGQRYQVSGTDLLPQPEAPFISALSASSLCLTWPELGATSIETYLIYVDGSSVPVEASGGMHVFEESAWAPQSTHTFRIAFRLKDGRVSPLSNQVSGKTWGIDANGDGVPDDWQQANWGNIPTLWPSMQADSDGDRASNFDEFFAGTNPNDNASVLVLAVTPREAGLYLDWSTTPGNMYQIQVTHDFKNWENLGSARFATSTTDTVLLSGPTQVRYYRVIRMR